MTDVRVQAETSATGPDGGGCVVLTLVGELDLATADDVSVEGLAALRREGVRELVVDLTAVTFLDSTALSALIELRNEALERDIDLRLRGLSSRLMRVFAVTGLHDVFTID